MEQRDRSRTRRRWARRHRPGTGRRVEHHRRGRDARPRRADGGAGWGRLAELRNRGGTYRPGRTRSLEPHRHRDGGGGGSGRDRGRLGHCRGEPHPRCRGGGPRRTRNSRARPDLRTELHGRRSGPCPQRWRLGSGHAAVIEPHRRGRGGGTSRPARRSRPLLARSLEDSGGGCLALAARQRLIVALARSPELRHQRRPRGRVRELKVELIGAGTRCPLDTARVLPRLGLGPGLAALQIPERQHPLPVGLDRCRFVRGCRTVACSGRDTRAAGPVKSRVERVAARPGRAPRKAPPVL